MFLHIGGDFAIPIRDIISIHNFNTFFSDKNKMYLEHMESEGKIIHLKEKKPKSIVITNDLIYLSVISSLTLKKRAGLLFDKDKKYGNTMEESEF
jgi:extracellular matrix regulatory protein B